MHDLSCVPWFPPILLRRKHPLSSSKSCMYKNIEDQHSGFSSAETSAPSEAGALQKWSLKRQKCLLFSFSVGIFSNDIFAWKQSMHSYLCISPTFSILALSKHLILDVLTDCDSTTSRFTSLPIIYLCMCTHTCRLAHRDRLRLISSKILIPIVSFIHE